MKHNLLIKGLSLLAAAAALTGAVGQQGTLLGATDSSGLDRTVLPIKEPTYPVGVDNETPVSNDYKEGGNKFTGTIKKVTVDVKPFNLGAKEKKEIGDEENAAAIAED